jgi:hypothetical protein
MRVDEALKENGIIYWCLKVDGHKHKASLNNMAILMWVDTGLPVALDRILEGVWLPYHPEPSKCPANLGLATTRELIEEIKVRIEIHSDSGLDYKTAQDDKCD